MAILTSKVKNYIEEIRNRHKIHAVHDGVARSFSPDEVIRYYDYLRQEITREDNITSSRTTSMLTFQGFLITALGFMMTSNWPNLASRPFFDADCTAYAVITFRENMLILLGLVGFGMAFMSERGIRASFRALDATKDEWEAVLKNYVDNPSPNAFDPRIVTPDNRARNRWKLATLPRAYGPRNDLGGYFGISFPLAFMVIWTVYIFYCLTFLDKVSPPFVIPSDFPDVCKIAYNSKSVSIRVANYSVVFVTV